MTTQNQKLIAAFEKNSVEVVKIHLQEWRSQRYLDIRVWTSLEAGDGPGEQPTKKGITLAVELLPELRKAIDRVIAELEFGDVKEKAE